MTNAELIEALQCASHFALYQDCYEKNCYANSGKGLYCNIPKLIEDAADALEAAEKRIAELMPKEGEWKKILQNGDGTSDYQCSACLGIIVNVPDDDEHPLCSFCPNCGARMRGERDEQIH